MQTTDTWTGKYSNIQSDKQTSGQTVKNTSRQAVGKLIDKHTSSWQIYGQQTDGQPSDNQQAADQQTRSLRLANSRQMDSRHADYRPLDR